MIPYQEWSSDVCFFFSSRRRHTRSDRDWSSDVCSFVSSRRRHTRSDRDWSSDVCSSDLSRRRHTRSDRDWSSDVCSSDLVTTRDGRDFPAKIQGEDPLTDIAVLKVDATGLPTAPLGKSTDLMIGEWVVAVGNPFAYLLGNTEPTVTAGVVSAVGRNLLPSEGQPGIYVGMIQTDAPINPRNSGGPRANAGGEGVGGNSSIFTSSGGSVGIGFAIPIERALRVADELRRFGKVRRAWVGLDVAGA